MSEQEQTKILNPYTSEQTVVVNEDGTATCAVTGIIGLENIDEIEAFKENTFPQVLDNFGRFYDGRFWCPPCVEANGNYLFPVPTEDGDPSNWRWEVGYLGKEGGFVSEKILPREQYSVALLEFTNMSGRRILNESQTNQNDQQEVS